MAVAGILLAAGAGRRAGGPKALRRCEDGEAWVTRAARTLRQGGCEPVLVVVGADAEAVAALVPDRAVVVRCERWAEGMGASLRAGLAAVAGPGEPSDESGDDETTARTVIRPPTSPISPISPSLAGRVDDDRPVAALVALVDTLGVTPAIVARLVAGAGTASLARAGYLGEPGHPVLIGRDHWPGVSRRAIGDRGARDYLADHAVRLVECADLGSGEDRDTM